MTTANGLNPRQSRFVDEYLIDMNATAAYKRVGYTARGHAAESAAFKLLRKAEVQERVEEIGMHRSRRVEIDQDYVLQGLVTNHERASQAEPVLDKDGKETGEYMYQGAVVNRSLELLGKHFGMFTDVVKHEGAMPVVEVTEG